MLLVGSPTALGQPPISSEAPKAEPSHEPHKAHKQRRHGRTRRRRRKLDLVQMTSGPGFTVLNRKRAWGQALVVWRLNEVLCAYHVQYPDAAPVLVQDLSKKGGGKLEPHASHRYGRDVDIGVVHRRKRGYNRLVQASPRTLNVERTWFLIHSLIQTGDVQYVFLNKRLIRPIYRYARRQGIPRDEMQRLFHYPRRSRWGAGIIRAEPGHQAHFHVRFFKRVQAKATEPLI
jgi:murein endopeptidase